jgi:hypothetical protein
VSAHERGEPLDGKVARLPHRYQRLVREVVERLPPGWMGCDLATRGLNVVWGFDLSRDVHLTVRGRIVLAAATADRFDTIHCWTITLFQHVLDHLSDSAVQWVIAHEFGYLARRVAAAAAGVQDRPEPLVSADSDRSVPVRGREAWQRCADACALDWGFAQEKDAYDREVRTL